ncbi:HAD family hydrolase [Actinoplanes subtropicus]|uniref:HAD family hydrolase n=1 Tax=Actinoplanes subtropicus TaxID=543632 RepID=UPI0004C3BD5D|nr:HAD family hydrolase [Actinoplanes subtropicus]
MQRLAFFDLDNTLVNRSAAFHAWAHEFVSTHRLDDAALTWLLETDANTSGAKGPFFHAVRDAFHLDEAADDLWQQYRRRMPELVSCRPQDLEALRLLRHAGWRIGIVTNGMTDNQHGKIHRAGLHTLVDGWCISDEVGIRKPDPAIFGITAQRCGTSIMHGGWMIGDDPILDVAGGRHAGLHTIWLPTGSTSWPEDQPEPDNTVATVADAVEVLRKASE